MSFYDQMMNGGGDLIVERGATIITNDLVEPMEQNQNQGEWKKGNSYQFDQQPAEEQQYDQNNQGYDQNAQYD